jgi:membrane protein DedA with SNARE-associated domain
MNDTIGFLVRHGVAVLFAAVFIEQLGLPIPAAPVLLAAGSLVVTGKMSWMTALSAAVVGSLAADSIWFYFGRRSGNRVSRLLCRILREPESCVRRTRDVFTRHGMRRVVVAKFLPGLSTVVPALAGSSGLRAPRFFFFDGIASVLYGGTFLLAGVLFSKQLEQVLAVLSSLGSGALALVAGLVALFIGYKYFRRQRLLREQRTAWTTVDELHHKQEAGENPLILDLQAPSERDQGASIILGALHMTMEIEQSTERNGK